MISIRRAQAIDAEAVAALTRAAYAKWVPLIGREPLPMQADHAAAVRDHRVDLAEEEGNILALVETIPGDGHLLIENLAVSPQHQGRGLGVLLLRHAEALASQLGKPEVRLYTNEMFEANIRFYEKHGYTVIHRASIASGGTLVYMHKVVAV